MGMVTAQVDTVVLRKFRAACVSKITVDITTFLPYSLMRETKYNGGDFSCFTAGDVNCKCSIGNQVRAITLPEVNSPDYFSVSLPEDIPEANLATA